MEATIVNFRRGRKTQTTNQMIVLPQESLNKESANKLVGKKVSYKTQSGKSIDGTINAAHGRNGQVRVHFTKGMPGQAIGKKVTIQ